MSFWRGLAKSCRRTRSVAAESPRLGADRRNCAFQFAAPSIAPSFRRNVEQTLMPIELLGMLVKTALSPHECFSANTDLMEIPVVRWCEALVVTRAGCECAGPSAVAVRGCYPPECDGEGQQEGAAEGHVQLRATCYVCSA